MRKGAKAAVIGSVFAVMVGGAGYGAFNIVNALNDSGTTASGGAGPAAVKSGPPSASEVKDTSAAFFAAWTKGRPRPPPTSPTTRPAPSRCSPPTPPRTSPA